MYGKQQKEFICYSGIPEKYIVPVDRSFDQGIRHFVFVGSLYKLKRVEDTLKALKNVFGKRDFSFDIVGEGAENKNLHILVKELGIEQQVRFHGQVGRDKAQDIVRQADCFVMVSSREAFGLVYVEAMAKGCITVATKGQGIDGVIVDGENGFLCESGNVDALTSLIKRIVALPAQELKQISNNAILTAKNMTDGNVARHYISSIR